MGMNTQKTLKKNGMKNKILDEKKGVYTKMYTSEENKKCDRDHRYNGWANYETWAVNLWITNDQFSTEHWEEIAVDTLRVKSKDDATYRLSEMLKDEISEGSPLTEATLYFDLLNAALSTVDWYEIAEYFIDAAISEKDNAKVAKR